MVKRAALIPNSKHSLSWRRAAFSEVLDLLGSLGVPLGETYVLRDPTQLLGAVREALADEHDLIILGGGDGSVSCVVGSLVGTDAVLGLLPLGTANDFARTLEIPTNLRRACETIARGKVVNVDLGLAEDDPFVNVASVGLGGEVTQALSPQLKRIAGALAYPVAAIKAFFRHEPFSATLTFPDGDHRPATFDRLLQVAIGNGRFYGGGMIVAPDSGIDDRTLDVYVIELGRRRDLLGVARYLKSGDFINREGVHYYRTSKVHLQTEPWLPINVDGELRRRTPLLFSLVPNALKVLVPEKSTAVRYDDNDRWNQALNARAAEPRLDDSHSSA